MLRRSAVYAGASAKTTGDDVGDASVLALPSRPNLYLCCDVCIAACGISGALRFLFGFG